MIDLWKHAERLLQEKDYYGALSQFLQMELEGKVCVEQKTYQEGLQQIAGLDANLSNKEDLLLLRRNGEFLIELLLDDGPGAQLMRDRLTNRCLAFCALQADRNNRPRILLAEQTKQGHIELCVYRVMPVGRGFRLERSKKVASPSDGLGTLTAVGTMIFVATEDGQVHQYNEFRFNLERSYPPSLSVRKLVGGEQDNSFILGVGRFEGLCKYSLHNRELSPIPFAPKQRFCCAAIADIRDIGAPDIIACTRGGEIFVFDSSSLEVIYEASVADEILDLCCMDVNQDSRVEILVGGGANSLYLFALNQERELTLERTWPLPHRVTHLTGLSHRYGFGTDKALVVGLENGEVRVFAFPAHREISSRVYEAVRGLKADNPGWAHELLQKQQDRVLLAFTLTQLTADLECEEISSLLSRADWDTPAMLAVLSKLKVFLGRCRDDARVFNQVVEFIRKLVGKPENLSTCEAAVASLTAIAKEPGIITAQIQELLVQAQGRLERIKVFKPKRQQYILEQIDLGDYKKANAQLEVLADQRIDLLETFVSPDRIFNLCQSSEERQLLYTTTGGSVGILDEDLHPVRAAIGRRAAGLLCLPIRRKSPCFLLLEDRDVVGLDENLQELFRFEHSLVIRTAVVIEDAADLYWVAGSDDRVILGDAAGQTADISIPFPVAKVLAPPSAPDHAVYVITVTGQLYAAPGILPSDKVPRALQLLHQIDANINVLNAHLTAPDTMIVIGTKEIVRLTGLPDHLSQETVKIPESPTCFTRTPDTRSRSGQLIVGARDKSLIFFDTDLRLLRTTFLDDIPMTLCCTSGPGSGNHLVIGFARGNVRKYRLVSDQNIAELKQRCDLAPRWQARWNRLSFAGKLVLVCLAARHDTEWVTLDQIYRALDPRISCVVSKENILLGVQSLLKGGTLTVKWDRLYSQAKSGFRDWVARHQTDPFAIMREHAQEIVDGWPLAVIADIECGLNNLDSPQWVSATFGIDPVTWHRAVVFSQQRRELDHSGHELLEHTLLAYFRALATLVGAAVKRNTLRADNSIFSCRMDIPEVAFQGFDEILLLSADHLDAANRSADFETLIRSARPRIALIIVRDGGDLLRGMLKDLSTDVAIMDDQTIKEIALAEEPKDRFLDKLIAQIDIASLSPFQIAGPVYNNFYGRESERHTIRNTLLTPGARNCAIIGPRRIGKTSLLLKAQDEISSVPGIRTLFLDAMPYYDDITQLYQAILNKLEVTGGDHSIAGFVNTIARYQAERKLRLVFFLDEVDSFLWADEKNDFQFFKTLRALINEAGVKVVVAGYQELYFQMKNMQSPLFNMLQPVELDRLEDKAAVALVSGSLRHVYSIAGDQIRRILEKTGYYPNFIQYFCFELIKLKGTQRDRTIVASDIDKVIRNKEIYEHMVSVYLSNLDDATHAVLFLLVEIYDPLRDTFVIDRSKLEKVKADQYYAQKLHGKFEFHHAFTPYDLHRLLELHRIYLKPRQIETLMTRLVLASVLHRLEDGRTYTFTLSDFPTILKKHNEVTEIATSYSERISDIFRKADISS